MMLPVRGANLGVDSAEFSAQYRDATDYAPTRGQTLCWAEKSAELNHARVAMD